MSIKVIEPGFLTTVQDKGRYGYMASGVQISGVMDYPAARWANFLVGNEAENCKENMSSGHMNKFSGMAQEKAVLEITCLGPVLEFQQDALIAVTGGSPSLEIDGCSARAYQALPIRKGQRLKIGAQQTGARAYLAVAGGFAVSMVMGSRSTNMKLGIGGWQGRKLTAGDVLPIGNPGEYARLALAGKKRLRRMSMPVLEQGIRQIRAVLGPQDDYFSPEEIRKFTQSVYTVSPASDRMGYRLQGEPLQKIKQEDLITDGIVTGSVQIPPDGQPIIMLADHQTTGGYPKIATVATVDLPILAQSLPGTEISFSLITPEEAQLLLRQEQENFAQQCAAIKACEDWHGIDSGRKHYAIKVNGEVFAVDVAVMQ